MFSFYFDVKYFYQVLIHYPGVQNFPCFLNLHFSLHTLLLKPFIFWNAAFFLELILFSDDKGFNLESHFFIWNLDLDLSFRTFVGIKPFYLVFTIYFAVLSSFFIDLLSWYSNILWYISMFLSQELTQICLSYYLLKTVWCTSHMGVLYLYLYLRYTLYA